MARLSGKIAIVTGSGGGIGQAIAQALCRRRRARLGHRYQRRDGGGNGSRYQGRRWRRNRDGRRRLEGPGSDGTRPQRRGSAWPRRRARQQRRHHRPRRGAQALGFRLDEAARGQSRRRASGCRAMRCRCSANRRTARSSTFRRSWPIGACGRSRPTRRRRVP